MPRLRQAHHALQSALVLAGTLALACAAIVAIGRLQADATNARDSQSQLVSLRLDLAQIQQVPWGAAPDEGDSVQSVHDELQGDEQGIRAALTRLSRDGALPDRSRVVRPFDRTMVALRQILDLLSKGRSDQTNKPSYVAAHQAAVADQALQRTAKLNRARSVRALRQSRIGSAAVILLLFLAFAWFHGRAIRARRIAEGLATDNERLLAASQKEALTDQLTGLGNRRALMTDLASWPAPGAGEQTLVLLLDLDGFKQYNDSFGHPAGDAVLELLGERLAAAVATRGRAYRMGGDEFCVVATVAEDGAEELAVRAASELSEKGVGFSIVCSHGTALMPAEVATAGEALRLADQRMYAHKQSADPSARNATSAA